MRIPGIRQATVYFAAFLSGGAAIGGSVRVQPLQDCSQRPKITVLRDGNPAAGISVEVYVTAQHPTGAEFQKKVGRALRTGSDGSLVLPRLPPGVVHVVAHWDSQSLMNPDLQADLWMRCFPEDPQPTNYFTMDLQPHPNDKQYVEELARTERKLVAERVLEFSGVVVDPGGARIPYVSIEVAPLHVSGSRRVRELKANASGHFAALLPAGDYIATFHAAAFRQTVHRIVIDSTAADSEMRIVLRPGAITE
jgi:hypothetical protein